MKIRPILWPDLMITNFLLIQTLLAKIFSPRSVKLFAVSWPKPVMNPPSITIQPIVSNTIIRNLFKKSKTSGYDKIPNTAFKYLPPNGIIYITHLTNFMF